MVLSGLMYDYQTTGKIGQTMNFLLTEEISPCTPIFRSTGNHPTDERP